MKTFQKALAIALTLAMLFSVEVAVFAVESVFEDVAEDAWYYEDVLAVSEANIMLGTDATHFSPNDSLTRGMMATILWRLDGEPKGYTCDFSDVSAETWYYDAIAWARTIGLVSGVGNGRFAPDIALTREQMAVMLYRYASVKSNAQTTHFDLSLYSDGASVSSYAVDSVKWLLSADAMHCENGQICPQWEATRADVAAGAAMLLKWSEIAAGSDGKSAYELAVENGYEGTLTEWLDSLTGEAGEDGASAYELAVENGYEGTLDEWLASLAGKDGVDGKDGKSAYELAVENGYTGTVQEWLASLASGGAAGADGKSAYEIAVENGYTGTEIEWLRSLAGKDGKSAYEIALDHGYMGTEAQWLASLAGENGKDGKNGASAYEIAVSRGYIGTQDEWLASLIGPSGLNGLNGEDGVDGKNGIDGKSAYDLAVELGYDDDLASWLDTLRGKDGKNGANGASAYELAVSAGYSGSLTEWLASLVGADGADGKSAYELALENGFVGTTQEWLSSLTGATGADGASAYELAVAHGYAGAEAQWLASLIGKDGKSAYEIALANGFEGTEAQWLASLKGSDGNDGADGQNGVDGKDGADGADGVSVVNAYVNDDLHLILVLSNGNEIDAGYVGVETDNEPVVTYYTVTFKDYDGTTLKTEKVLSGNNATPPADPTREGYTFIGWSGTYTGVSADSIVTAQYRENASAATTYTVTFQNYDGTVLKTELVEEGKAATAPTNPKKDGYTFAGWDVSFTNVTSDLTVTAQYKLTEGSDPHFVISEVQASVGEQQVTVTVDLKNNPGIIGMTLKLEYDDTALTLVGHSKGSALSALTLVKPSNYTSGCNFVWYGSETGNIVDGTVLTLTFNVSADAARGIHSIRLICAKDEIFDGEYNPINPAVINGFIQVK